MPPTKLNLPAADAVDYDSGNISYFTVDDPVFAGLPTDMPYPNMGPDNRPLRNLAWRDNLIAAKIDGVIDELWGSTGPAIFRPTVGCYEPNVQPGGASNSVRINRGRHVNSSGAGIVDRPTVFNSPSFNVTTQPTEERFDLLTIDDSGTPKVYEGAPVPLGTGSPFANAPAIPLDELAIAVIRIQESDTVLIDTDDITDIREFLNGTDPRIYAASAIAAHEAATDPHPQYLTEPEADALYAGMGCSGRVFLQSRRGRC